MLLIQIVISIIYLGSWVTFVAVRLTRVIWGGLITKFRLRVYKSRYGTKIMKAHWILRLVTSVMYLGFAFGFSIWLPEHFCEFIG